jgi:hypothetical protein
MKKFFLTPFIILTVFGSSTYAQTNVGVRAGMNISNVLAIDEHNNKNSTKSVPGYHLGLTLDILIIENFYLQPGAFYYCKGFKQSNSYFSGSGNDFEVTASYIEIPLNIIYKPQLGSGKVLIGAGAYAGYGTGGKWKSETNVLIGDIMIGSRGDVIFKKDIMDGEFENYLYGKPWDFGANFLVGYEFFGKLSLELNAQLGTKNLNPEVDGVKHDGTLRNKDYGISIAYKF